MKSPQIDNNSGFNNITDGFRFINHHISYLNNSKFFAGIIMILLNIGSKFIIIEFSKSTQEYLKNIISKQVIIFSMSWMATRDIYIALGLTAVFTVLSDVLLSEDSSYCIVPQKYRLMNNIVDTNNDGDIDDNEINAAIQILEKAKRAKQRKTQRDLFTQFDFMKIQD